MQEQQQQQRIKAATYISFSISGSKSRKIYKTEREMKKRVIEVTEKPPKETKKNTFKEFRISR